MLRKLPRGWFLGAFLCPEKLFQKNKQLLLTAWESFPNVTASLLTMKTNKLSVFRQVAFAFSLPAWVSKMFIGTKREHVRHYVRISALACGLRSFRLQFGPSSVQVRISGATFLVSPYLVKPSFLSVSRCHVGRFTVTVRRSELHLLGASEPERKDLDILAVQLNEILKREGVHVSRIAHEFAGLVRVKSVEVLDAAGNGLTIENK